MDAPARPSIERAWSLPRNARAQIRPHERTPRMRNKTGARPLETLLAALLARLRPQHEAANGAPGPRCGAARRAGNASGAGPLRRLVALGRRLAGRRHGGGDLAPVGPARQNFRLAV